MNFQEILLINAFKALEPSTSGGQHGRKSALSGAQELSDEDSPTDGPGTARAIDPNYCSKCAPKDLGLCTCDIACSE